MEGNNARSVTFESKDEQTAARNLFLLTSKPVLYVCNVDEGSAVSGNEYVERVREAVAPEGAEILVVAAQTEADIAELETFEERQEFLKDVGLEESGVNRLIKAAYKLLDLETFITAGEVEVHAWTYKRGWKAPQCAGVIHTDFEKGFIRAQVIKYETSSNTAAKAPFAKPVCSTSKAKSMWYKTVISCTSSSMSNYRTSRFADRSIWGYRRCAICTISPSYDRLEP